MVPQDQALLVLQALALLVLQRPPAPAVLLLDPLLVQPVVRTLLLLALALLLLALALLLVQPVAETLLLLLALALLLVQPVARDLAPHLCCCHPAGWWGGQRWSSSPACSRAAPWPGWVGGSEGGAAEVCKMGGQADVMKGEKHRR